MTKMVKTVILAAVFAVALQPTGICAVNNQSSSKFWKIGLIGAGVGTVLAGAAYLLNKFTSIPLHFATESGHINFVKALVYCGADIEVEAELGLCVRPLHIAAEEGYLDIVKFLVLKGADVNSETAYKLRPHTVLGRAAYFGHLGVVKFLVEKGANIDDVAYEAAENQPAIKDYLNLAYDLIKTDITFNNFAKTYLDLTDKKQAENNRADVSKLLHLAPKKIAEPYKKWLKNKSV